MSGQRPVDAIASTLKLGLKPWQKLDERLISPLQSRLCAGKLGPSSLGGHHASWCTLSPTPSQTICGRSDSPSWEEDVRFMSIETTEPWYLRSISALITTVFSWRASLSTVIGGWLDRRIATGDNKPCSKLIESTLLYTSGKIWAQRHLTLCDEPTQTWHILAGAN